MSSETYSDTEGLSRKSFDALVGQYYSLAYRRACALLNDPHLAHDATQEAFATAYQKMDQLRDPGAFPAWLLRLVGTHCSRMRRRKSPITVPLAVIENQPSDEPDPERQLIDSDLRRQIAERIAALPDREREATRLYYIEGYSQQQVADAIGVPVQTVKSRLYSSRRRLHRSLDAVMCAGLQFAPGVPIWLAIGFTEYRGGPGPFDRWHSRHHFARNVQIRNSMRQAQNENSYYWCHWLGRTLCHRRAWSRRS